MPQTINLKQVYPGLDPTCQSLRVYLYPQPVAWPLYPGAMPGGEVPLAQAHYCVIERWTGRNATGTLLPADIPDQRRMVEDTGPQTLQQAFPQATTLEDAIAVAFPPQVPD
jgi:hypothetical protein